MATEKVYFKGHVHLFSLIEWLIDCFIHLISIHEYLIYFRHRDESERFCLEGENVNKLL